MYSIIAVCTWISFGAIIKISSSMKICLKTAENAMLILARATTNGVGFKCINSDNNPGKFAKCILKRLPIHGNAHQHIYLRRISQQRRMCFSDIHFSTKERSCVLYSIEREL